MQRPIYSSGWIHFQANEKMSRWNDYYDSMDPKNKAQVAQTQKSAEPKRKKSATMKYLSVFPRKVSIHSQNQTPVTEIRDSSVGATNFQLGRYTSRNNDPATMGPTPSNPNNYRSDSRHTNFAWVD